MPYLRPLHPYYRKDEENMMVTVEPNIERIGLLADALDSGEFEQAQLTLRVDDRYCCLGVACEVARRAGVTGGWVQAVDGCWVFNGERTHMPFMVWSWFGFTDGNPQLLLGEQSPSLATMTHANDNRGLTFPEIAAALRRQYGIPEKGNMGEAVVPEGHAVLE